MNCTCDSERIRRSGNCVGHRGRDGCSNAARSIRACAHPLVQKVHLPGHSAAHAIVDEHHVQDSGASGVEHVDSWPPSDDENPEVDSGGTEPPGCTSALSFVCVKSCSPGAAARRLCCRHQLRPWSAAQAGLTTGLRSTANDKKATNAAKIRNISSRRIELRPALSVEDQARRARDGSLTRRLRS
jgi:hypothetical protein